MADQWLLDELSNTPKPTPTKKPASKVTPTVKKTTITPPAPAAKTGYNPISTFKTNVDTGKRVATAGLGKVADILGWSGKQTENLITGGQGYEKFYESNPVGSAIVNASKNKLVQAILPPAAAFQTPKRAALASSFALDPLNLVGAGVVSKIGKVTGATNKLANIGTKISKTASKVPYFDKAKDFIGSFKYGYGLTDDELKLIEGFNRRGIKLPEKAGKTFGAPLFYDKAGKPLPNEVQKIMGDIKVLLEEAPKRALTSDELKLIKQYEPVVKKVFGSFEKLAKQQIKLGVPEKVFTNRMGKYGGQRIFAQTYNKPKAINSSSMVLNTSNYKRRLDLSDETRKTLQEIKEPAYGAAVAGYNEMKNVEKLKLFDRLAKKSGLSQEAFERLDDLEKVKYVKMPDNYKYGRLSNIYIPKFLKDYVEPMVQQKGNKAFQEATKVFKTFKTVLSPKQLGRNALSSQVQTFLENPSAVAYLPKAIKEKASQGKFYKALKDTGEIATSLPSEELGKFMPDELSKLSKGNVLKKAWELIKKPGSFVQNTTEEVAKLQSFMARLYEESGKARITIEEALNRKDLVELARKSAEAAGFNYQKVSPRVASLRKGAVPFITYPVKASELVGKTLTKNPERLAAIAKGEQAVQDLTQDTAPDERYMANYLNQAVRVGSPDKKGATPYVNTKYIYPWGNMTDVVANNPEFNIATNIGISPSPFATELGSQIFNKDLLTGKPLSETGRVRHAVEAFAPSFVRSGLQAYDAATKNPRYSTSSTPTDVGIKETGLPWYKYNPNEAKKFKQYEMGEKISEIEKKKRAYIRDYKGKVSPEKFNEKMRSFAEDVKKVRDEFTNLSR